MYVICRETTGQKLYLQSYIKGTWTEILPHALSFRSKDLTEKVVSLVLNELDNDEEEEVYSIRRRR